MTFMYTKQELIEKIHDVSGVSDDDVCELLRLYVSDPTITQYRKLGDLYIYLARCNPNRLKCIDFLYNLTGYFDMDMMGECLIRLNSELFTYCIEKGFEMEWNTYNLFQRVSTYFNSHISGKETVYREICKMFRRLLLHSDNYFYTTTPFIREYSERQNGRYFKNMGPELSYLYTYITNEGITGAIDFVITEYISGKAKDCEGDWWLSYILSNHNLCEILVRDKVTHASVDPIDNHWTRLVTKYITYAEQVKEEIYDTLYTQKEPFLLSADVIKYCVFPCIFTLNRVK